MFKKEFEGFKKLLVYKKSENLMKVCFSVTKEFKLLNDKTLVALADQMDRSARSVKQNIVEGWLRNSTKEYLNFLGFSAGALAELLEDVDDVIKGRYERLRGIKGVMGEKGTEDLPFYPLDPSLPLIIQFKLQCKELSYLLYRLQQSLEQKMVVDGTLPLREKLLNRKRQDDEADKWLRENRPH